MSDSNEGRVERLLALVLLELMKGSSQKEKISRLNMAGFSNVEVAELLDVSPGLIAQHLYLKNKRTTKGRKKSSGKK
jgi:hypothetical protein